MPVFSLKTEIDIDAPQDKAWSVFSDFKQWPNWNSFMKIEPASGEQVVEGGQLKLNLTPKSGSPQTFTPKVLSYKAPSELRWQGRLLNMGWLFQGEHYFKLEPMEGGKTKLVHGEEFQGLLIGLMRGQLDGDIRSEFEGFNQAFKAKVEGA